MKEMELLAPSNIYSRAVVWTKPKSGNGDVAGDYMDDYGSCCWGNDGEGALQDAIPAEWSTCRSSIWEQRVYEFQLGVLEYMRLK